MLPNVVVDLAVPLAHDDGTDLEIERVDLTHVFVGVVLLH